MKNCIIFPVLAFCAVAACCLQSPAQIAGYPDFEIVESIPKGTVLDNAGIRDAHEVWLEMIKGAEKTIDLEQFYISASAGESLDDVISALTDAAERGVLIRFIVDSRMHKTYPNPADSLGNLKNISLRVIDFGKLTGGIQHAKYFIVDHREIFLGSQNFDWRALDQIHEIGVRIRNHDAVAIYQDVFDADWMLAGSNDRAMISTLKWQSSPPLPFRVVERAGDTLVFEPTMSPKGLIPDSMLWDERKIVRLIDEANHDVMVQVLTYSPGERGGGRYDVLDQALRHAAARGVSVKLIVSDWSIGKPTITYLKSLSQVPNIQVRYTSIPEWSGGYISFARVEHCKYLVADDSECWIGTSNWEKSYFYTVRNVGVVVRNKNIAGILRSIFLKSWDGPYAKPISVDGMYEPRQHGEQ